MKKRKTKRRKNGLERAELAVELVDGVFVRVVKALARKELRRVLLVVFTVYAAVTLVQQEIELREVRAVERQMREELSEIERESRSIQVLIDGKDEVENIEKLAREKGMLRPNEILYEDVSRKEQYID